MYLYSFAQQSLLSIYHIIHYQCIFYHHVVLYMCITSKEFLFLIMGVKGKIKAKNHAPKLQTAEMSVFRGSITEYPGVIVDHFTAFNCERGRVFFLSHCHKGTRVRAQAGEAWKGEEAQWDATCSHENSCSDLRLSLSQLFCCFH